MQKVRTAMESIQQYPLSEIVVDEFTVGGKEVGKQGRSYESKKKLGSDSSGTQRKTLSEKSLRKIDKDYPAYF